MRHYCGPIFLPQIVNTIDGGDYQCQHCRCCGQSADEVAERLAQAVANLDDHEPYPTFDG